MQTDFRNNGGMTAYLRILGAAILRPEKRQGLRVTTQLNREFCEHGGVSSRGKSLVLSQVRCLSTVRSAFHIYPETKPELDHKFSATDPGYKSTRKWNQNVVLAYLHLTKLLPGPVGV
jgi:hypothetical protein